MIKRFFLILLVLLICAPMGNRAFAATDCAPGIAPADCQSLYGNWVNWVLDPCNPNNSPTAGSAPAGPSSTASCCTNSAAAAPVGGVAGSLSVSQVPEPQRSLFIQAATKFNISPGALAGLFITEQNGFSLYDSYYAQNKDMTVFTGLTPTSPEWKNSFFGSNKGIWPNQGTFSGPFQFGSNEWAKYGYDGDGDGVKNVFNFFDEVYGAAHYFADLGGTLDKGADGIRTAAAAYNGQISFSIGGGIQNPGGQFAKVQDLYAAQVVLIAQGLSGSATVSGNSNLDYAGRTILTQGQLQAISQNQSTYQQAATQVDIPWQMLAVVHLRETSLKVANPGNGQGIYQFVNQNGGPYPAGPVDQAEFLRQTILAAQFLKSTAGGNYAANRTLTAASNADTIKDTFFSYNGRAGVYADQAATLGFNKATQGFEGSPYVMNIADANRDPAASPTTWGQIKVDHGGLEYPAGGDYGAFVTYSALTGGVTTASSGSGGGCGGGGAVGGSIDCTNPSNATLGLSPVRQNAVCIAEKELALWTAGTLKPGVTGGYGKYSLGRDENWCADFISWVYDQAKYPLSPDPNYNVPAVDTVQAIGQANGSFHYHPAAGYTPKPGDLIIHKENGNSHVNMVVGITGNSMQIIGGNQSSYDQNQSNVSKYTDSAFSGIDSITGYVTPD